MAKEKKTSRVSSPPKIKKKAAELKVKATIPLKQLIEIVAASSRYQKPSVNRRSYSVSLDMPSQSADAMNNFVSGTLRRELIIPAITLGTVLYNAPKFFTSRDYKTYYNRVRQPNPNPAPGVFLPSVNRRDVLNPITMKG
jgi:hypothetical protein